MDMCTDLHGAGGADECRRHCPGGGAACCWDTVNKKYLNFTDLGNYVIDCDRHKCFDIDRALAFAGRRYDVTKPMACTALATRANNGDVLIGRNLDLTISQLPCYISHLKFGKYETLNFTYDEMFKGSLRYDALLKMGYIDEEYYNALPVLASDSMNSEGLYIEYNMRGYEKQFICLGTNPGALRVCSICLPFMVASHCATVDEALAYMREFLDIYTLIDDTAASGWNLCCMIGDAGGNYGLIEIANDEIKFLPQQHGQGNYYIFPEFNSTSREQSGYGRLQFGLERIHKIQTEAQMAAMMEKVMWRNEIQHIPFAYRDDQGHIHFCADREHRIPSLDWRSDHVKKLPVNEAGEYIDIDSHSPEAVRVREYKLCYDLYNAGIEKEKNRFGYEKYTRYLERCNLVWVQNNENFEDLQRGLMKYYTENGAFEKLMRYYAGDETPLRNDGLIFTTALSFSVNCTRKRLTVRFWEQPHTVMIYRW